MSRIRNWLDDRFPFTELLERHVTKYPTPKNLNSWWNFGSLLMFFLGLQIVTGIFMTMYYRPDPQLAFNSVNYLVTQVNFGWLMRSLHQIGASFFFILLYLHMARGIYYGSYKSPRELLWWIGVLILMVSMAQSTTGYILPWGQLSYWAATVVTNFLSAIPLVGNELVVYIRGDYAVGGSLLGRFFTLHVAVLPIGILGLLALVHITALHKVGSNNPEGIDVDKSRDTVPFHPYYTSKDFFFGSLVLGLFLFFVFFQPDFFNEPINSEPANSFKTPQNITPEWYFLPFFAIIKSVPDKLVGLVATLGATIILFFLPYFDRSDIRSARYRPLKKVLTFIFFINFLVLGYVGYLKPFGTPLIIGRICTVLYYAYFVSLLFIGNVEKTVPLPERISRVN